MAITGATTDTGAAPKVESAPARGWLSEDWIAVVLGAVVIAAVLALFYWRVVDLRNIVSTFRWTTDTQIASMTPGWIEALDSIAKEADAKQQQNVVGLTKSLKEALASSNRKAVEAAAGKMAALGTERWPAHWARRFVVTPMRSRRTGSSPGTIC